MVLWQMIKTWFHLADKGLEDLIKFDSVNGVSYRFAKREDIKDLLEIERDVYEEIPWTYSHFYHEIVESHYAAFIVAEQKLKLIGYIGMRWDRKLTDFHVSNFIVRRNVQLQGIGSRLLFHGEELARSLKILRLTLEVDRANLKAQAFYRKHGFDSARIIEKYYSNGDDALEMEKELVFENH